jgi:hypothetical protein
VFEADLQPKAYRDLVEYADDPLDKYGPPSVGESRAGSGVVREVKKGRYPLRRAPLRVQGKADLELVLCPDNCLAEKTGLLGLIRSAKEELLVVQNSIPHWWGRMRKGSPEATPNLPLQAVVDAARRGVRVRVLLDGTWYNTEAEDPRDNDDTVRALRELAAREKLDLQAKVLNLFASDLEKVHAKGVIADRARVFVGSINWTENSFKGNREVGVVVGHKEIASYYADLFVRDWGISRLYRAEIAREGAEAHARPGGGTGGGALRKFAAGEVADVVSEGPDDVEVRLGDMASGWIPRAAVARIIVSAEEAHQVIGRDAVVEGRVRSTHEFRDGPEGGLALNFGEDWKTDFSVLIPGGARPALEALGLGPGKAEGRSLRVKGRVGEKNGPLIVLSAAEDVEFPR